MKNIPRHTSPFQRHPYNGQAHSFHPPLKTNSHHPILQSQSPRPRTHHFRFLPWLELRPANRLNQIDHPIASPLERNPSVVRSENRPTRGIPELPSCGPPTNLFLRTPWSVEAEFLLRTRTSLANSCR